MSIRHHEKEGKRLPSLLDYYRSTAYFEFYKNESVDFKYWNDENLLPAEYKNILKKRLEEMSNAGVD